MSIAPDDTTEPNFRSDLMNESGDLSHVEELEELEELVAQIRATHVRKADALPNDDEGGLELEDGHANEPEPLVAQSGEGGGSGRVDPFWCSS